MHRRSLLFFAAWLLSCHCSAQPPITALAFTPAGDQLVVGSQRGIEVRSWPSLEAMGRVESELVHVHDLQFSPHGKYLMAAGGAPSEYGEVEIFTWPARQRLSRGVEHDDVIYSAVWLSENRVVTGGADNQLIEWERSADELISHKRLSGHSRRVLAVDWLPKAGIIVSAGVDQSIRVWRDSSLQRVLDHHQHIVRDLAVRPGDHAIPYLASASADKTVRIWQPTIGRLVRFARLPVEPLSIAWTRDGQQLAVACVDGRLRIVNAATVKTTAELAGIDGWAYEVAVARDGSFAVAGANSQLARVTLP